MNMKDLALILHVRAERISWKGPGNDPDHETSVEEEFYGFLSEEYIEIAKMLESFHESPTALRQEAAKLDERKPW